MLTFTFALFLAASPATSTTTLRVEVVSKPADLQRGLQGHKPLGEGEGMLFVLPQSEIAAFWMKEMAFAIDILFLRADGTVSNVAPRAAPCKAVACPVFRSSTKVAYVLEVPAGWSERHGVGAGTRLHIDVRERSVAIASPVQ